MQNVLATLGSVKSAFKLPVKVVLKITLNKAMLFTILFAVAKIGEFWIKRVRIYLAFRMLDWTPILFGSTYLQSFDS